MMDIQTKQQEIEQEKRWKEWTLSAEDEKQFAYLFEVEDTDKDGFITGEQAKTLFSPSGLAMEVLGKIWSLSDRNKDQKLDIKEFCIAMFLINAKHSGETLPTSLPESLLSSVYGKDTISTNIARSPSLNPEHVTINPQEAGLAHSESSNTSYRWIPSKKGVLTLSQETKKSEKPDEVTGRSVSPPPSPLISKQPTSTTTSTTNGYGIMPPVEASTNIVNSHLLSRSAPPSPLVNTLRHTASSSSSNPYGVIVSPSLTRKGSVEQSSYSGYFNRQGSRSSLSTSGSNGSLGSFEAHWEEYTTEDGKKYYFETNLELTTWEKPLKYSISSSKTNKPAPPPDPSKENIATLLYDPSKIDFFIKFLESEESGNDNKKKGNHEILFFMDVQKLKQMAPSDGRLTEIDHLRIQSIYAKYIMKGSPFQIELEKNIAQRLTNRFRNAVKKETDTLGVSFDMFDEASDYIMHLLQKTQFPRFMKSMFYITMYNAMVLRSPYELPDILWREFQIAANGGVQDGWEYVTETKGVLVHKKQFSGSPGVSIRGSGVVPISPDEMYAFSVSIELRRHWDLLFSGGRVIEKIDEDTVIYQIEFRPPAWAVGFHGHDFVMIRTCRREPDGSILALSRSIVHKDAPVRKNYVRSEVEVSGFVIKPCGDSSSVVIYVNQAEMKGIPKWAESRFLNKRALLVRKIRKFVEKELKDKKKIPIWKSPYIM